MEKLELKHLAPYLPYECNFKFNLIDVDSSYKEKERIKVLTPDSTTLCLKVGTPILRPLSDLTKEIEVNGEKFVPAHELNESTITGYTYNYHRIGNYNISILPYEVIQKLFEWHFDVFGLIEKGLAIDINTLNL